jgi:hypothetical protein
VRTNTSDITLEVALTLLPLRYGKIRKVGLKNRSKFFSRLIDLLLFSRHKTSLAPFLSFHNLHWFDPSRPDR